jgi:multidrug efflux pump subunit AcrA (membrane-fusion protein)
MGQGGYGRADGPKVFSGRRDILSHYSMKTNPWSRCLVALCLVAVVGCARADKQAQPPAQSVHVVAAETRTVRPVLTLSGIVAPLQNVALSSSLQEPTDAVYVNEGDSVHKGQLLAQLNIADLQASLSQAQAHLSQTQYQAGLALQQGGDQVRSAQAALDLTRADMARDEQLVKQGYISVQQLDTQRTNVAQAQATLNQAIANQQANGTSSAGMQQANVAQAQAAVQQIQAQIARAAIVSPIDGVVVNRNLNPGEYPGTRQIFTLQEVARVYAELNAYGQQVAGIQQGGDVALTAPAVPGRTFAGQIDAILSPTTPSSSGFIIKVLVPNRDQALRPGMTVSAKLALPARSGIAIPVSSFIDDTHATILTVDADNVAHVARVSEVIEDPSYAVVTGLPTGTKVVVNGQSNVTDGQKVVASI